MSEEKYFFCWPLKKGIIFAGHFTSILSMLSSALAFAVFFRESADDDDGYSKLLSFSVACYAIMYIFISRSLIRGIKDERRDKLVGWIFMSIVTVIVLLSGIILVTTLFIRGKFQENELTTIKVLGTAVLCVFVSGILMYCIWGVVTLWRLYGEVNAEGIIHLSVPF